LCPPSHYRYILSGRPLEDGRELRDYNLQPGHDGLDEPRVFIIVRKEAPSKVEAIDRPLSEDEEKATVILEEAKSARARYEKLESELKSEKKFEIHIMEGDGNCMFRAVALQVFGDQEEHRQVLTMTLTLTLTRMSAYRLASRAWL